MTLRLILTRHAKSSWGDALLDDHDRPLNDRGRRSATTIGRWLAMQDYLPDLVLSSDAARTRETWALMSEAMATRPDVVWSRDLYLAPAGTMMRVLQAANATTVMMLGHNPGIAGFAAMLAKYPAAHPRFRDYPTGATTVMTFGGGTFSQVDWGTGTIVDFVTPRDFRID